LSTKLRKFSWQPGDRCFSIILIVAFFFRFRSIEINPSEMLRVLNQTQTAPMHLRKSDLATSICAAGRRCSLFTVKTRRGLRRSAQTRTRWPHPLRPERSVFFSPDWIDLVWKI